METNRPKAKFKAGCVTATVWENQTQFGVSHSVEITRSYKDKEGNWQNTKGLQVNDLPKAQVVIGESYRYILNSGDLHVTS